MNNNRDLSGIGTGMFHPADTSEYAQITVTVAPDGTVQNADFTASDGSATADCARAVCNLIKGFPARDVLQMNNKAVYYNLDEPLPLDRLFCATIAVAAAKKAVISYLKSIGEKFPEEGICSCFCE